jgi:uncharacterized protein YbjT (DUF2867 family)
LNNKTLGTNILITGATGNVGLAVAKALAQISHPFTVYAGVRNVTKAQPLLIAHHLQGVEFDFTEASTYLPALAAKEVLFLVRPPQISAVNQYFKPMIAAAKQAGVRHIIFLSVQGVEKSRIIPHHKIEALIRASGIAYTFLRPAYFMQNFTTTLRPDLVNKQTIFLPAGEAKFTLIDVEDIGRVVAHLLLNPSAYLNHALDLTNQEKLTFGQMADQLSTVLGRHIEYRSPSLWRFFWHKWREQVPPMFILVMIMLHYLPRFQAEPAISGEVERITGHPAKSFEQFVQENRQLLT